MTKVLQIGHTSGQKYTKIQRCWLLIFLVNDNEVFNDRNTKWRCIYGCGGRTHVSPLVTSLIATLSTSTLHSMERSVDVVFLVFHLLIASLTDSQRNYNLLLYGVLQITNTMNHISKGGDKRLQVAPSELDFFPHIHTVLDARSVFHQWKVGIIS